MTLRQKLTALFRPNTTGPTDNRVAAAEDEKTLDFDPENFPACPRCGAKDVAKVLYGKPPLNRQILAGLESGKLISGGCMIRRGAPEWHCNHCRQDFGQLRID